MLQGARDLTPSHIRKVVASDFARTLLASISLTPDFSGHGRIGPPDLRKSCCQNRTDEVGASRPTIEEVRFAGDSPLEGDGFELAVPRKSDIGLGEAIIPRAREERVVAGLKIFCWLPAYSGCARSLYVAGASSSGLCQFSFRQP
jgi:hypothetical protein